MSNLSNEESIEVEGEVIELLPNTKFKVKYQMAALLLRTYRKMRMHFIKILPGDKVVLR